MPTITLTPTACSSSTGQWIVLYNYLTTNSSYYPRQFIFTFPSNATLGGAGVNITSVTLHGYVRNGNSSNKQLRWGFRPSASAGVAEWADLDGTPVIESTFTAIDGWEKSGYDYKRIARSYSGSSVLAKWLQKQFAAGENAYLGVIQPTSGKSISTNTTLAEWTIDVDYELLGNIPTTDKTSVKLGETITTTVNRIIADSTTVLNYKLGDTVLSSASLGTGTSHAFTVPTSAGAYFPAASSATLTIEAVTSQSGTEYGAITTTAMITLPEDSTPTITAATARVWLDSVPSASRINAYVQKQSGAQITVNGSGKYGASVILLGLTIDSATYTADGASATFRHLPFAGSGTITGTVSATDSRGNVSKQTVTVDVLPWSAPTIQAFGISRAYDTGETAIDGTCAKAEATASVSSLVAGTEQNTLKFLVQYREIGATDWLSADLIQGSSISSSISGLLASSGTIIDTFNDMSGYEFRLTVSDLYSSSYASDQMPTKEQFWDINETSGKMGFGGDAPTDAETAGYRFFMPIDCKQGYKVYSTSEVDTGNKWIDGKPIYRAVISTTTTLAGAQGIVGTLPSAVESPVSIRAFMQTADGTNWRPVPYAYYGDTRWTVGLYINGASVYMSFGALLTGTKNLIIIAEYTKGE